MKDLVCELCEGKDIIKVNGLFVCQNCGAKYTPEEAKTMVDKVDPENFSDKKYTSSKVSAIFRIILRSFFFTLSILCLIFAFLSFAKILKNNSDFDIFSRYEDLVSSTDEEKYNQELTSLLIKKDSEYKVSSVKFYPGKILRRLFFKDEILNNNIVISVNKLIFDPVDSLNCYNYFYSLLQKAPFLQDTDYSLMVETSRYWVYNGVIYDDLDDTGWLEFKEVK